MSEPKNHENLAKPTGFPPKVFMIGAQKAGTTQLSALLAQHQDICLSEPKEPDYFTRNYDKGEEWYKGLFADLNKVLIDASTSYTSCPLPELYQQDSLDADNPLVGVPERIFKMSPEAKLIYIVRNPVKRLYSGYWHQVTAGHEQRPLLQAVEESSYYKRFSKYAEQLEAYLAFFPSDNVLVVEFEELIAEPQKVLNQCLNFIGLPEKQDIELGLHKNKSFQLTGALGYVNRNLFPVKPLLKTVRKFIPDAMVGVLSKGVTKNVPKISDQEYQHLNRYFDDEVAKVKAMASNDKLTSLAIENGLSHGSSKYCHYFNHRCATGKII